MAADGNGEDMQKLHVLQAFGSWTFFFVLHSDRSLTLTCEPIRPNGAQGSVCLLWTGAHYDLLRFEPGVLAEATQCAGFAGEVQAATSVVAAAAASDAAAA